MKKTIQEKIAVMQAFADGKAVEFRAEGDTEWFSTNNPEWNWNFLDYRVKQDAPRTWEDFCERNNEVNNEYFVSCLSKITITDTKPIRFAEEDVNLLKTREDAEGLLSLIKLKRLRDAWWGDWRPNWTDDTRKFFICERPHNVLATAEFGFDTERRNLLSFPTREMAEDFLACFEGLIKQAEMWL